MKTPKILLSILLASVLIMITWAFFLPANIHIEEKVIINAPVEQVFEQVNNFRNWRNWTQWQDSTLQTQYEGEEEGIGAKMIWHDKERGTSVQTIIVSEENKRIITELSFIKEEDKAQNLFSFKSLESKTEVSWAMDVNNLSYPFGRFVGYMLKKGAAYNFSQGLNKMKKHVEKEVKKRNADK